MFPGTTTKLSVSTVASATSIVAKSDLLRITGSTQVDTIRPNFGGGFCGVIFVTPTDGNLVFGTGGNILVGATVAQNRVCTFVYDEVSDKWRMGAIS